MMASTEPTSPARRRLIKVVGASALATTLAGCSSDGGDSSGGNGSSGNGGGGNGGNGGNNGGQAASTSGDAAITAKLSKDTMGMAAWDSVESFVMNFERLVLERENGSAVEISVGETVDAVALPDSGSETYVEDVAVPEDTYTTAKYYLPIQEASTADGSIADGKRPATTPIELDLEIMDEYMDTDAGSTSELTMMIRLAGDSDDGYRFTTSHQVVTM